MSISVTTQEELDNALTAGEPEVIIDSPAGVWLRLASTGSARVEAWGSASVVAWGSASVVAWDSARVVARGSARVVARGSASVVARDSASVAARDSARVEARDSARVEAQGSASVVARDSASVAARGSARVVASKYTAVHLHSTRATVTGGVVIDLTKLDLTTTADWADYHGVKTVDGDLIVYKAVDADLNSGRGFHYPIGGTVAAPDWKAGDFCGAGLHFSPSPAQARDYYPDAARFLECAVDPADVSVIDGADTYSTPKLKARTARVLREVDLHGDPL
jgi:hypothetical protein